MAISHGDSGASKPGCRSGLKHMRNRRQFSSQVTSARVVGVIHRRTEMGSAFVSRFDRLARLLGCLLLVAIVATGTTRTTSADADAETLLANSATAMTELQSFHFDMSISTGEILVFDSWEITHAEGDVAQPQTMQASLSGMIKVLPVTANVVVIGDQVWAAISPGKDRFSRIDLSPVAKVDLASAFDPAAALVKTMN